MKKSPSVERLRAFTTSRKKEDKKSSETIEPQVNVIETAYKATNWQHHDRIVKIELRTLKIDLPDDVELYITIKAGGIQHESSAIKLKNLESPVLPEQRFEVWKSYNRARDSFSDSVVELEINIIQKKRMFKDEILASNTIPSHMLEFDCRNHELSMPLLSHKSSEMEHNFKPAGDDMSPSSYCIGCGKRGLRIATAQVCKCGQYVHTECLISRQLLPCRSYKGVVALTYKCDEKLILPLPLYGDLIRCLVDPQYAEIIAFLMANASNDDKNEMVKLFLRILESCSISKVKHCSLFLLEATLLEIENPKTSLPTLFRGNSIASKAMDAYFRLVGQQYLHDVLCPVITKIVIDNLDCEISPDVVKDQKKLQRNEANLVRNIELVMDAICSSANQFPPQIKTVLKTMRNAVKERFPESENVEYIVVNSFVFLRFFVTAIVSPKKYGILVNMEEEKIEGSTRTLALLSKAVQNIGSMVMFGQKEPYLKVLNPTITQCLPLMKSFSDDLSINFDPETNTTSSPRVQSKKSSPVIAEAGIKSSPALHTRSSSPTLYTITTSCTCPPKEVVMDVGENFAKNLSHIIRLFQRTKGYVMNSKAKALDEKQLVLLNSFFGVINDLMKSGIVTDNSKSVFQRRQSYLATHVEQIVRNLG